VKHEWNLLHECNTLPELEELLTTWIERYNTRRPQSSQNGQTPWEVYRGVAPLLKREITPPDDASEIGCLSASASSQPISQVAA
jgi:hypothetical protein